MRPSFVLVGIIGEGSWLAGGSWPAIPFRSFTEKVKMDRTGVFQSSYTVHERAQPCCLASECYRQSRTGGGRSRYRNLKYRMVEYLGEFWSEDLASLFEPLLSFLHMYSCLRQSCHIKLWYYPGQEPEQYFEIRMRNNTTASMTMHTSFFGAVLQVHPRETSVGSLEELKVHF